MSRIIKPYGVGQERNHLIKAIVISIRELMKQQTVDRKSRDLAAFIAVALEAVDDTVERTVTPWEKRDYWLKADKFRLEWDWVKRLGPEMRKAVLGEDWGQVASLAVEIGGKLNSVKVSERHRMGQPWVGAWDKMIAMEQEQN